MSLEVMVGILETCVLTSPLLYLAVMLPSSSPTAIIITGVVENFHAPHRSDVTEPETITTLTRPSFNKIMQ